MQIRWRKTEHGWHIRILADSGFVTDYWNLCSGGAPSAIDVMTYFRNIYPELVPDQAPRAWLEEDFRE